MAKLLKLRRGTTTQHASFTGAEGEVTIDITKDTAVVHDGSQAGGRPLAREDMANVSSASIAGQLGTDSIATSKIAAGALPTDVTITNANIVANASIAGTKLENSGVSAGQYGSSSAIPIVTVDAQGLVTAASTTAIDSTTIANGSASVAVSNNGPITSNANHDFSAGIDVTGDITATGNITTTGGYLEVQGTQPQLRLNDTDSENDFEIQNQNGNFVVRDIDASSNRFVIDSNGTTSTSGNLDVGAGLDVTGNITCTGTVDGVDIAARNTLFGGLTSSSGVLSNGVTGTTQAQSDNSTKVSTTAYVRTAITEAKPFPSGTLMLFAQTSAPTGWTKSTTHNNKALRVVSGSASSGGSNAFTTAFGAARGINANAASETAAGNVSVSVADSTAAGNVSVANQTQGGSVSIANTTAGGNVSISSVSTSGTVNSHTLSVSEMPSHSHGATFVAGRNQSRYSGGPGVSGTGYINFANNARQNFGSTNTYVNNTGGGGGHSHGFSGSSHNHNGSLSGTAHTHNATFTGNAHNHNATFAGTAHNHNATGSFSGTAHNHSISVGNLDMAVQYVDVIIASKD